MSDTNAPQVPTPQEPEVSAGTAHPQAAHAPLGRTADVHTAQSQPAHSKPAQAPKKMSTFLKVSIVLLIGLTLASISLLFIGDFEGRFERVFSTFALFAVFVVLTAIDTSREKRNEWYAPVALIANTYILGLLLIVIWMTPYNSFSLMFEIIWKSFLVIVVTRLVIVCCEVLLRSGEKTGGSSVIFAFITSVLAVLAGILYTAPVGLEAFNLHVPDLYWKIATSVLILTALGLSVTLLLRWSNKADQRLARREAQAAAAASRPFPAQQHAPQQLGAGQPYLGSPEQGYGAQAFPAAPTFPAAQAFPGAAPYPAAPQFPAGAVPTQPAAPLQPGTPMNNVGTAAGASNPTGEGGLLPWPTFADGRPIPAGPDGQPDFTVPGAPRPPSV